MTPDKSFAFEMRGPLECGVARRLPPHSKTIRRFGRWQDSPFILFQMHDALADGVDGGFGAIFDVEFGEQGF